MNGEGNDCLMTVNVLIDATRVLACDHPAAGR